MTEPEIKKALQAAEVLKEGHFLLTSGLHSPQYVDKFQLLKRPGLADPLLEEMASRWKNKGVELVIGPAVGGILLAYEVAKHLGTEGFFLERENGVFALRRGFSVKKSQKVLVVEDIVTTGGSVREVCRVITEAGAEIAGIALLVDRSGGKAQFDAPVDALLTLDLQTYEPSECPLCEAGIELTVLGRSGKDGKGK